MLRQEHLWCWTEVKTGAIPKQQNNSPCFLLCATWSDHLSSGWLTPSPSSALKHWCNKDKKLLFLLLWNTAWNEPQTGNGEQNNWDSQFNLRIYSWNTWGLSPDTPSSPLKVELLQVKSKPLLSVAQRHSFTHNFVTVLSHQNTHSNSSRASK